MWIDSLAKCFMSVSQATSKYSRYLGKRPELSKSFTAWIDDITESWPEAKKSFVAWIDDITESWPELKKSFVALTDVMTESWLGSKKSFVTLIDNLAESRPEVSEARFVVTWKLGAGMTVLGLLLTTCSVDKEGDSDMYDGGGDAHIDSVSHEPPDRSPLNCRDRTLPRYRDRPLLE
jgi:hypothetical protein